MNQHPAFDFSQHVVRRPPAASPDRPGVLHVVLGLSTGGTERLVVEISKRLEAAFRFSVCCLDQPGELAEELTARGIPVDALQRTPGFRPSLARSIADAAARHQATVLHCHHYSPFVYGRLAALLDRRLRVVFTEHGRLSDAKPSTKRRLVNTLLGRLPSAIYAVSEDLRRHMIAEGLPGSRIGVVHNGIDPRFMPTAADRASERQLLGIDDDTFLVGTAARLDPVKDLETLIDGFARFGAHRGRSALCVIGDGPERSRLEEAARHAGVFERMRFTGHRSDVRRLLPALDVYVNSSTTEGISLTILEAMAAGLPVVATHVGGNPEVVIDHETGLLVRPRSGVALAAALNELAAAPQRAVVMGAAGRFRVKRHFTLDRMTDQYARVYRRARES